MTLTRDEARSRSEVITDLHYDVALDLRDGPIEGVFGSRTRIRFTARPGRATFADLGPGVVERAELNGRPVHHDEARHRLLLDGLAADNELTVDAAVEFATSAVGLRRIRDPGDGTVTVHAHFQPFAAHRVFCCFDQPDLRGRFTLTVRAPADWTVVSATAARAVRVIPGGREWSFGPTPPLSTYHVGLAAGHFHIVRVWRAGVPIEFCCRPALAHRLRPGALADVVAAGLVWFTEAFGRPFPYEELRWVFVPDFPAGGMENVGAVMLDESHLRPGDDRDAVDGAFAELLLHELCHMWFGNLVTISWWDDLWFNEAFATHFAHRAMIDVLGRGDWAGAARIRRKAQAYTDDTAVRRPVPDTAGLITAFGPAVYVKAAALLDQLELHIGADAFHAGIGTVLAEHAHASVRSSEVIAAWEGASDRNLEALLAGWFDAPGVAVVDTIARSATGADPAALVLSCSREGPLPQQVRVEVHDVIDDRLVRRAAETVEVTGGLVPVPGCRGQPRSALLLPNADDRAYLTVRFADADVATLERHLGSIPDAVARSVAWHALAGMAETAHLPASRWVAILSRHAGAEPDIDTIGPLFRQGLHTADHLCADGRTAALRRALAHCADAAMRASAPGGRAQLFWLRQRIAADPDPSFAHGLLDGALAVDGVELDTELSWHLVLRLATLGAIDGDSIDAVATRDPSPRGSRRRQTARASRPDRNAKDEATTLVWSPGSPYPLVHAVLDGFWRPGQEELLEPYWRDWPNQLAQRWYERGVEPEEELIALTTASFPRCRASAELLDVVDQAIGDPALPMIARTVLRHGASVLRDAVGAQQTDLTYPIAEPPR